MTTDQDQGEPRIWRMSALGDVIYSESRSEATEDALSCLDQTVLSGISVEIPAHLRGTAEKAATTLRYDFEKSFWRDSEFSDEAFEPSTIEMGNLLRMRTTQAAKEINEVLARPNTAHMQIADVTPTYSSGLDLAPPERSSALPLRAWRHKHSDWLKASLETQSAEDAAARDTLDQAFEVLQQVQSPVDLHWDYRPSTAEVHHVVLTATSNLKHPLMVLRRSEMSLIPDRPNCVSAEENCRNTLMSFALALAIAIRLFAADRLGTLIVTCQIVENLEAMDDPDDVLQVHIQPTAWVGDLAEASRTPAKNLPKDNLPGLEVFVPGDEGWVQPVPSG